MSTRHLRNISLSKFESFLELAGCKLIRRNGGHIIYCRSDLLRPITIQSHIDPVPEIIIKTNLRTLNLTKNDFFDILELKKEISKVSDKEYILK